LGEEISLKEVPEWKELKEKTTVENVTQPLFAYFKMPEANTIDTSSPLGVSGFSRAVSLIKDADLQYSRLLWEYEAGEMAIDIDRDALREIETPDGNTHTIPNHLQDRLYRKLDLGSEGDTYFPFAPSLRDTNYVQGLNTILMRIEDVCGISRGTLSDSADVARTATELKILKQRSYQTNADIQQAIEDAIRDVIYIMNVYCTLYEITPEGEYEVNFEWDDSIMVDIDEEINKRITLMQNGLTSKLENRMWYFGETEVQAREALAKISEENQQAQEADMIMQYEMNNRNNNNVK
jgi:A118 family predicted phage portal protein